MGHPPRDRPVPDRRSGFSENARDLVDRYFVNLCHLGERHAVFHPGTDTGEIRRRNRHRRLWADRSNFDRLTASRRRRRFQDPWLTCWLVNRKFLGYWRCWREQRLGRLTRLRHPLAIIGVRAGRGVTAISGPTWWMIFAHIFCNWIAMDCALGIVDQIYSQRPTLVQT